MTSPESPRTPDEFSELTRRVCDGTIDERGRDRLEALLTEHAELRREYVDYLEVNARLAWRYRTGPPGGPATRADAAESDQPTSLLARLTREGETAARNRRLGLLATAVAALAASVLLVFGWSEDRSAPGAGVAARSDALSGSDDFIATLRESTAAVWRDGADALDVGGRVARGKLRLGAGRADLVLDSGVRLLVEGPADLSLESSDGAFLESGKVAVHVPDHAIGFTLSTPTSTLIDQGTEFGVVAEDSGATEVHVFRGQVDLLYSSKADARDNLKRVSLTDRQARRVVAPGSEGAGVMFSRDRFRGLAEQIAEPIRWPISEGGNGHLYQLVTFPSAVTWQQAAVDAAQRHHRGMPGHLVTVTSEAEHRFLVDEILIQQPLSNAWIGLTDVLREGYFRWVTGEPIGYECWARAPVQQPDNFFEREGHGGEDYGTYSRLIGQPWAWNDLSNDSIHQFVTAALVEYEAPNEATRSQTIVSEPIEWTADEGGGGQFYRLVLSLEPLSWKEAADRAASTSLLGKPGHLAAFETEAEQNFAVDKILRVCGVAENLIGLSTDSETGELRWITGAEFTGTPHTTPNIPAERVYGQMRWLDGAWRLQTVSWDSRPAGWFGYLIEYPPRAAN